MAELFEIGLDITFFVKLILPEFNNREMIFLFKFRDIIAFSMSLPVSDELVNVVGVDGRFGGHLRAEVIVGWGWK